MRRKQAMVICKQAFGKNHIIDAQGRRQRFCKREVLNGLVEKYTPQFSGMELPENMVKSTAVIELQVAECTGKHYK